VLVIIYSNFWLRLKNEERNFCILANTSLGGPDSIMESKFKLAGQANVTLNTVAQQNFALQGVRFEKNTSDNNILNETHLFSFNLLHQLTR